ncbi:MAG TPA: UvrB/UvrC motif-containing protein [Sphingobacteriaceae bacterium]|nr:UvrB/UvrC motif-containing protein [Sphingobacteriaceae bacterium]
MLCTECGKRRAVLHVTRVVNGHKTEVHLCDQCAAEQGHWEGFAEPSFSIHDLLASLLPVPGHAEQKPAEPEKVCPGCGLTYQEFTQSGLLGCRVCYDTFGDVLEPVLRRIHGGTRHEGKAPPQQRARQEARRRLEHLRAELKKAVAEERYEDAARLRDQIRTLERDAEGKE